MTDFESAMGAQPGSTGSGKAPQRQVKYRQAEGARSCQACVFFQGPDACQLVEGPVSATGLCDLWQSQEGVEDRLFSGPNVPPAQGGV